MKFKCLSLLDSGDEVPTASGIEAVQMCTGPYLSNEHTTKKRVFDNVGRPMVQAVLEGFNATIFAYGQTGSGNIHVARTSQNAAHITLFVLYALSTPYS